MKAILLKVRLRRIIPAKSRKGCFLKQIFYIKLCRFLSPQIYMIYLRDQENYIVVESVQRQGEGYNIINFEQRQSIKTMR